MKLKNIFTTIFCAALILSGCTAAAPATSSDSSTAHSANLANPFVNCKDESEAADIAGFSFYVPELYGEEYGEKLYPDKWVQAIEGEMIQVCFLWEDEQILFRKGKGEADISGDYNEYTDVQTILLTDMENVGDTLITVKGLGDGDYRLATWTNGGYSYSISSTVPQTPDWLADMATEILYEDNNGSM